MYGVLGLTKIEDEEGSSAYLYGKDTVANRHFMLVHIFPTLYQDHETNRRNFFASMEDKRREIEENDKLIEKLRKLEKQPHHKMPSLYQVATS
jgi:hypothetical protein